MTDKDSMSKPNKSFSLINRIEYQAGSVVSRELLKTEGGTVTLFAFDRGQGLSEHTIPFEALVYVADGKAQITISGITKLVYEGQMICIPAGKPHALKAEERFKMMLIMLK